MLCYRKNLYGCRDQENKVNCTEKCSLGDPVLDAFFSGGLPVGSITEFVGEKYDTSRENSGIFSFYVLSLKFYFLWIL